MLRCPKVQIVTVGRQRVPLPIEMYRLHIWPNGHHNHVSYGAVMMDFWRKSPDWHGMIWLEGDIAITPEHLSEMMPEIECYPDFVVTVPYLLYPRTTNREVPMWSVQGRTPTGQAVPYRYDEIHPREPAFFSLGCTYLPRKLLDLVDLTRGNWDYPCLDTRLSELAREHDIICISTDTPCLHLNY